HARDAVLRDAERAGGGKGKIDDAPVDERPAVVDTNGHGAAVLEVRHPQAGSERERRMRRGHRVLVEPLSARGSLSLMALPVPGGGAELGSASAERPGRRSAKRARATRQKQNRNNG